MSAAVSVPVSESDSFDWEAARTPHFYQRRGERRPSHCPHCRGPNFGFHSGRTKECLDCGFDRNLEGKLAAFRFLAHYGRRNEIPQPQGDQVIRYWRRVYGVPQQGPPTTKAASPRP